MIFWLMHAPSNSQILLILTRVLFPCLYQVFLGEHGSFCFFIGKTRIFEPIKKQVLFTKKSTVITGNSLKLHENRHKEAFFMLELILWFVSALSPNNGTSQEELLLQLSK